MTGIYSSPDGARAVERRYRELLGRWPAPAVHLRVPTGLSAPSRPPLDSDAYAAWLDDVLAGLGVERTAIAGVSLGGELAEFALLIHKSFRPRRGKVPIFGDEALRGLAVPLLVIAGGRDALLDSYDTRRRLARTVPQAGVRLLSGAGHLLPAHTREIMDFLETAHA